MYSDKFIVLLFQKIQYYWITYSYNIISCWDLKFHLQDLALLLHYPVRVFGGFPLKFWSAQVCAPFLATSRRGKQKANVRAFGALGLGGDMRRWWILVALGAEDCPRVRGLLGLVQWTEDSDALLLSGGQMISPQPGSHREKDTGAREEEATGHPWGWKPVPAGLACFPALGPISSPSKALPYFKLSTFSTFH